MNLAFVTSSLSRQAGGLFFSVRSLATALDALDPGRVAIHGLEDSHTAEDLEVWAKLRPVIHSVRGPSTLGWAPSMRKALINSDCDLLHTQGIWQWPSAAVHHCHRHTGRPYLISPRGMLDPWAVANSRWKKRIAAAWYESAHLRDAACLHALCQSEAESIRAYGLKNPVAIISNGVDLPVETEERFASRQKTEDRKILLFFGRLHPKKGLVNALRAWHEIRGRRSEVGDRNEWTFAIAGWDQGGHRAELEQLCREIGVSAAGVSVEDFLASHGRSTPLATSATVIPLRLSATAGQVDTPLQATSGRDEAGATCQSSETPKHRNTDSPATVLFLGPAFGEAKDALLRLADAFILPSFSEGLPMSVLEAWSYRLPVLMTDHCNLPEGFAAEAAIRIGTECDSIAHGMHQMLQSSTHDLQSIGRNGRFLVERQFTWPQVAAQMKEVYEWVLGGGPRPCSVVL